MGRAEKKIKSEIERLSKGLNKCKSRWLNGYIDGLTDALKWIKEEEHEDDHHQSG